jgi:hypothetical protein
MSLHIYPQIVQITQMGKPIRQTLCNAFKIQLRLLSYIRSFCFVMSKPRYFIGG